MPQDRGQQFFDGKAVGANDPQRLAQTSPNSKEGSFHKGRNGYYEDHHSRTSWIGGCNNCKREQKAGKHPLAS